MPAHFFCAQPHAPMSLLAMAALVGCALGLESYLLHDGHVGHVTGWHVAQSLPSRCSPFLPLRTTPSLSLHSAACVLFCGDSRSYRFASYHLPSLYIAIATAAVPAASALRGNM